MADPYAGTGDDVTGPSSRCAVITPNDSADLPTSCKAIYVGGAGDIALTLVNDSVAVLFKAVPVGTVLRVRAKRVNATATTATNLVALL